MTTNQTTTNDPFIFLIFSSRDKDLYDPDILWFCKQGYKLYMPDFKNPRPEDEMRHTIRDSGYVVVFMTPAALQSRDVMSQIRFAGEESKPMLCIQLAETVLPDDLEQQFGPNNIVNKWLLPLETYQRKLRVLLPSHLINQEIQESRIVPEESDISEETPTLLSNDIKDSEEENWQPIKKRDVKITSPTSSVLPISLSKQRKIETESQLINFLDTQEDWRSELIDDEPTRNEFFRWIDHIKGKDERNHVKELISFYSGVDAEFQKETIKPENLSYLREALIRFFDPEREIRIGTERFRLFTSTNKKRDVEAIISKLDEILLSASISQIRFYLFQLEFSLRQLKTMVPKEMEDLIHSLIEKIFLPFGLTQKPFTIFRTDIQFILSDKQKETSLISLIELFYAFNPERKYRDIDNTTYYQLRDIGFTYLSDRSRFNNAYCKSELIVFLRKNDLSSSYSGDYDTFIFNLFNPDVKSGIEILSVDFNLNKVKINYRLNKSLNDFLRSYNIQGEVKYQINNNRIELTGKSIPDSGTVYDEFLSYIYKQYNITKETCDTRSLVELKQKIDGASSEYIKNSQKKALFYSTGIFLYILPIIAALAGLIILFFPPTELQLYLNSRADDQFVQLGFAIGYIYFAILLSLLPSSLFNLINHKSPNVPRFETFSSSSLLWAIPLWALLTGIGGLLLAIALLIFLGIISLFGYFFSPGSATDSIMVVILYITTVPVLIVLFMPAFTLIKQMTASSRVVFIYALKGLTYYIIFLLILIIFGIFYVVSNYSYGVTH